MAPEMPPGAWAGQERTSGKRGLPHRMLKVGNRSKSEAELEKRRLPPGPLSKVPTFFPVQWCRLAPASF